MTTLAQELALIPGRVAAGIEFTKKKRPGFKLDKSRLRMFDACGCVLAQMGGGRNHERVAEDLGLSDDDVVNFGFLSPPHLVNGNQSREYYDAIETEWISRFPG